MILRSGRVNEFFEVTNNHLLSTFNHTVTLWVAPATCDMSDVIILEESANFLVHIFLPFIRDNEEGQPKFGKTLAVVG